MKEEIKRKEKDEEYKYQGMSYWELSIVAGVFMFLVWFFFNVMQ